MNSILLVDFNPSTHELLCPLLRSNAFEVTCVTSIADAMDVFVHRTPRIIIVDRELPDGSGLAFAKFAYDTGGVGVIVWTANNSPEARLVGFRYGIDYYLSHETSHAELVACVQNLLRRLPPVLNVHSSWLCSREDASLITPEGFVVRLTPTESRLMCVFVEHLGQVVGRDAFAGVLLKTNVSGFDKNLKVIVNRLKQKVFAQTGVELPLKSVRNIGYRFTSRISLQLA
jgi:two-component system OmpR family response regulator